MNICITGGAGFIGSHVVRHFVKKYPNYKIHNLDALTYAGNLENLRDIENEPNYSFLKADIHFIQDNESKSSYSVLRGLHFQKPPFEQTKLVRLMVRY